ncbi:hypothetical protein D3C72_967590 [compost metagenome]
MRVTGPSSSSSAEAQAAAEAARKAAAEAARKAAAEAAKKAAAEAAKQQAAAAQKVVKSLIAAASADADKTAKPTTPRGTSALQLKTPEKLAETVQEDPSKLAEAAVVAPEKLVKAAAENPGKITDALVKGAGVLAGGLVGSEAFQLLKGSLSAQKKVGEIKDLTSKITEAKAAGTTLAGATGTALKEAAEDATKIKGAKDLDKLGKLGSGLSVASGVNSALNLRHSVAALKDGATAQELATVAGDALGSLRGADDAVKLMKGSSLGFLGGKLNPTISIMASGADSIKRVDTLIKDWDTMSTKDKVSNFATLGGNLCDIVGSGMVLSGVGAPIGVALKGVGAGLSLVSLGISNAENIKTGVTKAANVAKDVAEDVADGAKKVASALNPFD